MANRDTSRVLGNTHRGILYISRRKHFENYILFQHAHRICMIIVLILSISAILNSQNWSVVRIVSSHTVPNFWPCSSAYRSGRNQCNLCSDEKLFIMKFKKNSLLNKRSEIFSNCVHKKQFLAGKYIRVQSNKVRHHTRRKNAQACTRKQTKPNGQI